MKNNNLKEIKDEIEKAKRAVQFDKGMLVFFIICMIIICFFAIKQYGGW